MRTIATFLCLAACLAMPGLVSAQSIYAVNTDEKLSHSTDIIEGKVVDQQSFWNAAHTMIFTSSKIEVYKVFKGNLRQSTIEVVTAGGTIGTESVEASDLLTLEKDNIGVFFCYPNAINLRSPSTGQVLYDVYAGSQGCLKYDLDNQSASAPFSRYASIQNDLYPELVLKTGRQPVLINSAFGINNMLRPADVLAPVITSFSPSDVTAGAILDPAKNLLIITGTGFGAVASGACAVIFDDANNGTGGTGFIVSYTSSLIQSWSDTEIRVQVPSRAGTGTFQVRDAAGSTISSGDQLVVIYSVLTATSGAGETRESNLMDDNGSGGYTVLYSTSTSGSGVDLDAAPQKATFQRALNTWREVAGINFSEGGTTTRQTISGDNENVIMFDNTNTGVQPLAAGVLAVCYSYTNQCTNTVGNQLQKTGFDIIIRNQGVSAGSTTFTSGPCKPATSEIDLETVLLHELGHALDLAHVNDSYEGNFLPNINAGKLMNYAVLNGVSRRSPDYAALYGALYTSTPQANTYGSCGLSSVEMTPLVRSVVPQDDCSGTFPTVTTPANTSVNFDLVHATSNKFVDPQFTSVNCAGTGTGVTNNAYYPIRTDSDGGILSIAVSGYTTLPASVSTSCTGAGIRLTLYRVGACPIAQAYPTAVGCRVFNANGSLTDITGLLANTRYLIYLDGIDNTKASFTLLLNGTALPVSLVNFTGNLADKKVQLRWTTSEEVNTKEFAVEKSFDGVDFASFAVKPAVGLNRAQTNYALVDESPFPNYTYYRLKVIDNDGRHKYSQIVKVKTASKAIAVTKLYPNPAKDNIYIQVASLTRQTIQVEIFDIAGKRMRVLQLNIEAGVSDKPISLQSFAAGSYFVQIKDAGGNVIEKKTIVKN